jgi:hypothetical protein
MGIVILEMDQFAHGAYDAKCELARQLQIVYGYGGLPVHMIRYNPDQLPQSVKISIKDRDSLALERIQAALARASTTFHVKLKWRQAIAYFREKFRMYRHST